MDHIRTYSLFTVRWCRSAGCICMLSAVQDRTMPKLLDVSPMNISFQPPIGKSQKVQLTFTNPLTEPIAYKLVTNKLIYYAITPSRGVVGPGESEIISFVMTRLFTKKKFKVDAQNHEFHLLAMIWPKNIEDFDHSEWKKREEANKDELQRHTFTIDFKEPSKPKKTKTESSRSRKSNSQTMREADPPQMLLKATPSSLVMVGPGYGGTLVLSNLTSKPVAFKIQTHKGKYFVVHPNKGLLVSNQTVDLHVELNRKMALEEPSADRDAKNIYIFSMEWPGSTKSFSVDQLTKIQKIRAKGMHKFVVTADIVGAWPKPVEAKKPATFYSPAEVELGSRILVAAFPSVIDIGGTKQQTVPVTLMNMGSFPVGFKIEADPPGLSSIYTVQPQTGIIKPKSIFVFTLTCKDNLTPNDPKINNGENLFLIRVISWPMLVQQYNEEVWGEYFTHNGIGTVIKIKLVQSERQNPNQTINTTAGADAYAMEDTGDTSSTSETSLSTDAASIIENNSSNTSETSLSTDAPSIIENHSSSALKENKESDQEETSLLFSLNPVGLTYKCPFGATKQTCTIKLCNLSRDTIAYKVQANKHKFYVVTHSKAVLNPGQDQDIKFELLDTFKDSEVSKADHRFQVIAFRWPNQVKQFNAELWRDLEQTEIGRMQRVSFPVSFIYREIV